MNKLTKESFILDPCVATTGFEFLCKSDFKVDLDKVVKIFKKNNVFVEKDNSPFFIVVKSKYGEANIFNNIKIIVRVETKEEAYDFLEQLLESINKSLQE
jgi:hypothetical protein